MTTNFDDIKDTAQDDSVQEEEYYVTPSRAEFIYEEGMEEAEEVIEGSPETVTAEPDSAVVLDGSDLELPAVAETTEPLLDEKAPEFVKFNEDFKKYAGVDFKEAVESMNAMRQELAQVKVKEQRQVLQSDWGLDGQEFESRLTQVVERFARYSPEIQAKYDTTEGAKLIWAAIERDNAKNEKQLPGLQRSSTKVPAGSQPKYMFSAAQINKMSNEEYSKNAAKIQYAYTNGLVKQ